MNIIGIAIAPEPKAVMIELPSVTITRESGILQNHRGAAKLWRNKRQVTILSLVRWNDACKDLGVDLPWSMRRANICLDTFSPGQHLIGAKLFLGEEVILQITGETEPCNRMDALFPGLQAALQHKWRGGVTCTVITGGTVRVADKARLDWHAQ